MAIEEVKTLVDAERDYLTSLKTEPLKDAQRVSYAAQLQKLSVAQ